MSQGFDANRLDVRAFARAGATLRGQEPLSAFARLLAEAAGAGSERPVQWQARGETRQDAGGLAQVWLFLRARASLPLVCQRCLGPADIEVVADRAFRFAATEAQAAEQDEQAEEDVLVLSREFNLRELVEDELLMALPLVPRHEVCPVPVTLAVQDADFEAAQAAKPNPFAALAGLKAPRSR